MKKKRSLFKKRHYVAIIRDTVRYLTRHFGYKIPPFVFESVNPPNVLMMITRGYKGRYGIFYDYMQFKRKFGHLDFEGQTVYAATCIAHEMRHYYQMRQLDSPHPTEAPERLAVWRKDEETPKKPLDEISPLELYMQPMELDAALFSYVFVARMYDIAISFNYVDEKYINILEEYYIELFGETNEDIFPQNIEQ